MSFQSETTDAGVTYATAGERRRLTALQRRRLRLAALSTVPVVLVAVGLALLYLALGPVVLVACLVVLGIVLVAGGVVSAIYLMLAVTR